LIRQASEEDQKSAHCGNGQVIAAPAVDTLVRDNYTKFCQEIAIGKPELTTLSQAFPRIGSYRNGNFVM
jgi:hypothetical protein